MLFVPCCVCPAWYPIAIAPVCWFVCPEFNPKSIFILFNIKFWVVILVPVILVQVKLVPVALVKTKLVKLIFVPVKWSVVKDDKYAFVPVKLITLKLVPVAVLKFKDEL